MNDVLGKRLSSRPLRSDDLAEIEGWFDDPVTQRWLGGRSWPRRLLDLAGPPDRLALVWLQRGEIVALLDVDRYGEATAAVALVVSPACRRRGIGARVLRELLDVADLAGVARIVGEVERGNGAGEAVVRAAGFVPDRSGAADEGFSRWVLRRHAVGSGSSLTQ